MNKHPYNRFEDRIVRCLAEMPLDYNEQLAFIQQKKTQGKNWASAAVLVLLGKYGKEKSKLNRYFFLLNKRSVHVQQPGDLCFPGGHPNRWIDPFTSRLIHFGALFAKSGSAYRMLRRRNRETLKSVIYFLGNSLRESYEEIHLNPFKVVFLGALQSYRLDLFQRVIFPMVGIVNADIQTRPNWEVERIIKIPLSDLLTPENYSVYNLAVTDRFRSVYQTDCVKFDCFVHREKGQKNEILWGASYQIVQSFLRAVFDFDPPEQHLRPVIEDELYPDIT
ncbi:hypothetical protein ACFLZM_06790 [Thermodesulfobacteriota bacterium]